MTERYSAEDIPHALDRLIEAWLDRSPATAQLEQYKRTKSPPQRYVDFTVERLQEYHRQKMEYEARLEEAESEAEAARVKYEEAQAVVRTFLPENSRLFYAYQGERSDIKDSRYIIQYRGRRFTVEPYTSAQGRSPWA
jgi:secreted Zn-dependent insulinase-like peptidase